MELIDVPVLEKNIHGSVGDGSAKSRLDRFLLTKDAISSWKVAAQWVGNHDISDHCPIWLDRSSYDWARNPSVLTIAGYSTRILKILLKKVEGALISP